MTARHQRPSGRSIEPMIVSKATRMALELGATRCLRKPFTPGALLTVVNECLAEARFSGVVKSG